MSQSKSELVTIATRESTDSSPAPVGERARSTELAVIVAAVFEDQAELDQGAARLRELCVPVDGNQASADPSPAVLIEEFESRLIPHFIAEEVGELYGSLFTEEPRLLRWIEYLQAEHAEIAEALGQLMELARSGPPRPELAVRLTRVLDWVDAHERAENALMGEFLLLDLGRDDEMTDSAPSACSNQRCG